MKFIKKIDENIMLPLARILYHYRVYSESIKIHRVWNERAKMVMDKVKL